MKIVKTIIIIIVEILLKLCVVAETNKNTCIIKFA